jgi:hypothetical protein
LESFWGRLCVVALREGQAADVARPRPGPFLSVDVRSATVTVAASNLDSFPTMICSEVRGCTVVGPLWRHPEVYQNWGRREVRNAELQQRSDQEAKTHKLAGPTHPRPQRHGVTQRFCANTGAPMIEGLPSYTWSGVTRCSRTYQKVNARLALPCPLGLQSLGTSAMFSHFRVACIICRAVHDLSGSASVRCTREVSLRSPYAPHQDAPPPLAFAPACPSLLLFLREEPSATGQHRVARHVQAKKTRLPAAPSFGHPCVHMPVVSGVARRLVPFLAPLVTTVCVSG